MLTIESVDKQSVISIKLVEVKHEKLASVCLAINVNDFGFCGNNERIWLGMNQINSFLEELDKLATKQGRAVLNSISPKEFGLVFQSQSLAQHIQVNYKLSRNIYHPEPNYLTVQGGFMVAAAAPAQIVANWHQNIC